MPKFTETYTKKLQEREDLQVKARVYEQRRDEKLAILQESRAQLEETIGLIVDEDLRSELLRLLGEELDTKKIEDLTYLKYIKSAWDQIDAKLEEEGNRLLGIS